MLNLGNRLISLLKVFFRLTSWPHFLMLIILVFLNTVNSLYGGQCRDLELVSLLARVRNSESLFQSILCNFFYRRFTCCPYYRGVHNSGVSARRQLTVTADGVVWNCTMGLLSLLSLAIAWPHRSLGQISFPKQTHTAIYHWTRMGS